MHRKFKLFGLTFPITFASVIFSCLQSAIALEVNISPTNPQLGDTISVFVTTDDPKEVPTVKLGKQDYPVFALKNGYRALIPTSPLDQSGKLTLRVTGDDTTKNLGVWLKGRSFPTQKIRLSGKASRSATQTELNQVANLKKLVTPFKYWDGSFLRPNPNRVSTTYGVRRYYNGVFAQNYYHRGVDYAGGYGSPVIAPAAGTVKLIGKEANGFHVHGNLVGLDHGQGLVSIFMHLQDIKVKEGDLLKPGQIVGTIGSTGASTGPHLHWGLYLHGVAVDPVPWRFQSIE